MLFFELTPKTTGENAEKQTEKGQSVLKQLEALSTAFKSNVLDTDIKTVIDNISQQFTTMEDSAIALQRTMGGVVVGADQFRQKLESAVFESDQAGNSLLEMNLTFKDAVEFVSSMASSLGRMVPASTEVTRQALEFSKASNMTSQEVGKMVIDFSLFGGTQKESVRTMSELGTSARKSGLDAKSFTTEVAKNLKQASLFGFKGGVKDIEEMVKKTKLLGTSLEKLGIGAAAKGLLDPEKAMETAANLQMIGGNIGALGDPFQLLYMGQKDMKKLTDEVLNMSKATFTFDKTTGAFTQTTEDMYALRAQAEALGVSYEETANAGKELAKVDFVKSSTNLAEKITDKDTQNLVAGLSQISKDGKVSIELPGLNKSFDSLDDALDDPKFMSSLEEYQKNAALSDKDLAMKQMSIAERQEADVNVIMHAVVKSITNSPAQEKALIDSIRQSSKESGEIMKGATEGIAEKIGPGIVETNKIAAEGAKVAAELLKSIDVDAAFKSVGEMLKSGVFKKPDGNNENDGGGDGGGGNVQIGGTEKIPETGDGGEIQLGGETKKTTDGFFPSGDKPTLMSRGKIYEGLAEDSVYMGTDFEKIFSRAQNATNLLSEVMGQKNNAGGNTEVSGKIDFGTLTVKVDAPSGVDKSVLEQALNGRQFTTHIMNMVANQKSFYSNQSTLEG
jgi:hypothetical protein